MPAGPVTIAADTDRLWVGSLDAGVVSSLPTSGSGGASQQIGRVGLPTGLAVGNGQAWSADAFDQTITLIETATGAVNKTISGVEARQIEFGGGSGWAADDLSDSIHRLDGQSGDVAATIALDAGAFPRALAVGPDSVWVANAGTSTVARIDLKTSAITAGAIPLRYVPDAIAAGPNDIWIASSASDTAPAPGPGDERSRCHDTRLRSADRRRCGRRRRLGGMPWDARGLAPRPCGSRAQQDGRRRRADRYRRAGRPRLRHRSSMTIDQPMPSLRKSGLTGLRSRPARSTRGGEPPGRR